MINFFLLIFFLLPHHYSWNGLADHAVYVSVIEIEQISGSSTGSIKVKLFADDLEDAIQNQTGEKYKLTRNCEKNQSFAASYIKEHLEIHINGAEINYGIVSCENVDMSAWFDFEFESITDWQEVEIIGDHLMELFPTQSNVFSVKYNDQKKMFRLTNSKKKEFLTFE